jgi:hypothetical protein
MAKSTRTAGAAEKTSSPSTPKNVERAADLQKKALDIAAEQSTEPTDWRGNHRGEMKPVTQSGTFIAVRLAGNCRVAWRIFLSYIAMERLP